MKSLLRSPVVKKVLLSAAGVPLLKKLDRASNDVKTAQNRVLSSIIEQARDTVFGREHHFSTVKTIADYQSAVPIRDFEGHRPYIDRMCHGEPDVLVRGKPLFYNTTSGTTEKPKLIPVSPTYFEKTYNDISRIWFYTCLRDNPRLFHGQNLSAVSPAVEGHVADGTPFGSISGVIYRNIPKILRDLYAVPYPIICMKDYQMKYYAMMRCALSTTISYIITVNPSTLLQFHRTALDHGADIIKDIHDGTLRTDAANEIDPAERSGVLKQFPPDPQRARQLESIFQTHEGHLLPLHYWPDLVCINTWKQGNCSLILPKIAGFYPKNTVLREFGYQASEARAGIVLGNDWNYSLLLAHLYLFEFIEASSQPLGAPSVLQSHELEIGKSYYLLFSNGSGLYRYNINDIIRVTGFYRQFPLVEFIQKGEGVTSLTGEKLSEVQVIRSVEEASKTSGLDIGFYTMFCDRSAFKYRLYAEFPADADHKRKMLFLASVDSRLKYYNPEYATKRGSRRLHGPDLIELQPNSYELLKKRLIAEDLVREGQYKVRYLNDDSEMMRRYDDLAVR
ncbi:MAG: GH3 auxin-responsive promoter family protein [Chitinispirillaceae bacterium]|nr:GH3 auxin-responsive promoter family protein [Chitinispirillaceae bacterium]